MKKKQKRRFPPGADFAEIVDDFGSDLAILHTPEIIEQRENLMQELADFRGRHTRQRLLVSGLNIQHYR